MTPDLPPAATASPVASSLSALFAGVGVRIFHRRMHVGLSAVLLATLVYRPRDFFGAHATAATLVSLLLVVAGLALRAWAAGCAGGHTRLATIEAPRLATGGPFAHVRNPIYLASVILGAGMVGLLADPWMLALCVAVFVFLYTAIVPAEERFLRGQFGDAYARYCAHVPRLLPRLRGWSGAEQRPFERAAMVGEVRLAILLVGIYAGLRGAARLRGWWLGF
ncbi:MAG: isoprenylcysteine carboxylmethyltransferase family protein [Chthoniobacter sp.]|nr:isoprenylcysteine carboxylmethyltransferase family protein [Chthoniobacter sp.]